MMVSFYTLFPVIQEVCPSSAPWSEPFWHMDPFSANCPLLQLLDPLSRTADHPLQQWSCPTHHFLSSCESFCPPPHNLNSFGVWIPFLLICPLLWASDPPLRTADHSLQWWFHSIHCSYCPVSFPLPPFSFSVKVHSGYPECFLLFTHWNIYLGPQLRL